MKKTERYLALDVLRGITIALMIIVNTPGSWKFIYPPLQHAAWHGCTPTDLVFPFFLFVVGVSMFFSFDRYQKSFNRQTFIHVGRRAILIFVIGLFLNSFPQWTTDYSHLRIMGVLQRIALAYGFAAIIVLTVPRKLISFLSMAILLAYWGILYFFGTDDPYTLQGNAVILFDTAILGANHMFKGFGLPFDPEGILSSLPAIVTVLIGYLAGVLIKETEKTRVPLKLIIYGTIGTVAGLVWGLFLPINKPLWTSSYVLYTAGLGALLFAVLIFIIDIKGYRKWTSFFVVFGMNPLFIFALSGIWARILSHLIRIQDTEGNAIAGNTWLFQNIFVPLAGNMNGSLLYALTHIFFFWLIGYVLYRNNIFIKV